MIDPDFFATPALDALVISTMCIFLAVAIVFCVMLRNDDDDYMPPIRR